MFITFFLKEIKTGFKSPMLYIFFFLFTMITTIGVVNESITLGGSVGNTFKNAPHIMSVYIGRLSLFAVLIATAFFNHAALRDYQHNFSSILFSTAIDKASYFFGRFFGALVIAIIPLLGVFLGFVIGTDMSVNAEVISPNRMGTLYIEAFVNNFLLFVLPNMFIVGVLIFTIANKWKSTIVSFIGSIIIIVGYLISGAFLNDVSTESWAAITDILGINAYTIDTKYFTSLEKNTEIIAFSGLLLLNRIVWISIAVVLLLISYRSFSFTQKNQKVKKEEKTIHTETTQQFSLPVVKNKFNLQTQKTQFISLFKINFFTLLKSNTFKIMLIIGALILLNKLINGLEYYGLQSYPVTHKMLDFSRPISMIVGMIMLVFFSGELIWRERANYINGVIDGTPHNSLTMLIAKIIALISINVVFDIFLVVVAILYQLANGYTNLELTIYVLDFIYSGLPLYIIWSCIFIAIQIIVNHKYLAYFIAVLLLFLFEFIIVDTFGIQSFMVNLGFTPTYTYSDMNGFSIAVIAKNWFNLYWILFGIVLIVLTSVFWIRGNVKGMRNRWKSAKKQWTKSYITCTIVVSILFVLTSSFVYYNTQLLNLYHTADEIKNMQESYEKKYKQYEGILQPKITAIDYDVAIYPTERNVTAKAKLIIQNKGNQPIDSLHYSLQHFISFGNEGVVLKKSEWKKTVTIPNATLVHNDDELGYQIFKLAKPLLPNESMQIQLETTYTSQGFENSVSNIRVVQNGTFFDSSDILPIFGYEAYNEISDANDRESRGLAKHKGMKSLEDVHAKEENYITRSMSDWVIIATTVSTAKDQIAVAPGTLEKQWIENERSYFKYKNDHVSLNFTNFMSATYEVARKKWNGIDIEVYYDKAHAYNIDIMLAAVEKSLTYYTENFGPYFHKQARVVEIPRYYNFAQAFPGTMPYTEGGGFITNLSNAEDYNIIYSTIAHEIAHQYWAHQVIGANVQGATMLSESFAEYSALMVMKNELKDPIKMKKLLAYDFERYLRGRSSENGQEKPLYIVEDQGYIHYGKGSLVLYALQEYIGEDNVNEALRAFLKTYAYKEVPYPTTVDFMKYLEPQIPVDLKYLLTDWFKKVTLYDYSVREATYETKPNGIYEVAMTVEAMKLDINDSGELQEVAQHNWVEIGVYADNEEKELVFVKRVLITEKRMSFTFQIDQIPAKVAIDPKRLLIERVIDDNVRTLTETVR
ncbi:M1 family aminopeptidase [uncultured Kordia sp.]|uniref:ABC transporter permease/M1 family aminopeptidase n=1 Tax=uncultured Kordia sp. TaxID=507699 RepID=UPI00260565CF|nr:M1 family aminopeptidase [uncultured Kordia sp.]